MNTYDIDSRMQRIADSVGKKYDHLSTNARSVREQTTLDDGTLRITTSFVSKSDIEKLNIINQILFNIANLKDSFKEEFSKKGIDATIVEREIEKCEEMKVLIDLVNQEKHGYPLKKFRHSKKDPLITKIIEGIALNHLGLKTGAYVKEHNNGNIEIHGDAGMEIIAEICDGAGNFLYQLDSIISCSLRLFETLKEQYLK